jgi:hypothetical protein
MAMAIERLLHLLALVTFTRGMGRVGNCVIFGKALMARC